MRKRQTQSTRKSGQSLVEFALVIPLLLLVIMGIFDLGWAIYAQNIISNAAAEGARSGIILSTTDADIQSRIRASTPGLTNLQVTISPTGPRTADQFGTPITVTVVYTYHPITPIIGQIVTGSGLRLSATSVMKIEGVVQY
jgi:Flp pilus assembly protein TadG